MTLEDVKQYMMDLGYCDIEETSDFKRYEGKSIKSIILHFNNLSERQRKSTAWYHFEYRQGDIYDDWSWYFNGKAYNSFGDFDVFEQEVVTLNKDILEEFINKVEDYKKS